MAKTKDTLILENALSEMAVQKGFYGCQEVTIGFANKGMGKEIADYILMDPKGLIRCYEIKVSLSDLKSKAKLSWYGNYNYLVVSENLADHIEEWKECVPEHVGIITGPELRSIRRCKFQEVPEDISLMLKESLVRTLYYKLQKSLDAQSIEKQKELQRIIRRQDREICEYKKRAKHTENLIAEFEKINLTKTGEDLFFEEIIERERTSM